jgi:hypothetical protein
VAVVDEELSAMASVVAALEPLDTTGRQRVLQYACQRYGIDPVASEALGATGARRVRESVDGLKGCFDSFAELYDAADPRTDPDRALVSAWWVSIEGGEPEFQAQPVNTALKNLGHPSANITEALTALKRRSPSLVLQVEKRGKSRQARKSYKLTVAGIRAVEDLVAGKQSDQGE